MLADIWQWMQFHTWLSLACLAVGAVVTFPLLLSTSFRKRMARSWPEDLEAIGMIVLIIAIVGIGLYNYLGSSAGA